MKVIDHALIVSGPVLHGADGLAGPDNIARFDKRISVTVLGIDIEHLDPKAGFRPDPDRIELPVKPMAFAVRVTNLLHYAVDRASDRGAGRSFQVHAQMFACSPPRGWPRKHLTLLGHFAFSGWARG